MPYTLADNRLSVRPHLRLGESGTPVGKGCGLRPLAQKHGRPAVGGAIHEPASDSTGPLIKPPKSHR